MFFISQLFQNRSRLQPCKHWTQSQKDNRNNLIQHLDRREASSRLHSVVAYSVSNKTWAKCPASFSSRFWSASIQKETPSLSFDFLTHSASGWDFLEAVLHLFCSDQSVAKVLAECTRKAGGQPERPRMLQTLQPQYQHILINGLMNMTAGSLWRSSHSETQLTAIIGNFQKLHRRRHLPTYSSDLFCFATTFNKAGLMVGSTSSYL